MSKISYDDKVTLKGLPEIAEINKVTADNLNEIKSVVNSNYEDVGDIANLNTSDVSNIVNAVNEINSHLEYSTTPTIVGKWVDGSDVYQQVFQFTPTNSGGGWQYFSGLDSQCKKIISMQGAGVSNSSELTTPIPKYEANTFFISCAVSIPQKSIAIIQTGYNNYNCYLIVRYLRNN